jgi:hypothetical protein
MGTKKNRLRRTPSLHGSATTVNQMEIVFPSTIPMSSANLTDTTSDAKVGARSAPEKEEETMNKAFHAEPKADLIKPGLPTSAGEIQLTLSPDEQLVANQVQKLWDQHEAGKVKHKKSQASLKQIRIELAERLCELKAVHCRAGRSGLFSATLKTLGIPRSTANRLVAVHENAAKTEEGNCPNGTTTGEPTCEEAAKKVRQLAVTTWSRLKGHVPTFDLLTEFIEELTNVADASFNKAADVKSATVPVKIPATAPSKPEMAAAA